MGNVADNRCFETIYRVEILNRKEDISYWIFTKLGKSGGLTY